MNIATRESSCGSSADRARSSRQLPEGSIRDKLLERHITLDLAMYGSDQAASIEPSGLRQHVAALRKIEKAMGDGDKRVIDAEVPIVRKLREHLGYVINLFLILESERWELD